MEAQRPHLNLGFKVVFARIVTAEDAFPFRCGAHRRRAPTQNPHPLRVLRFDNGLCCAGTLALGMRGLQQHGPRACLCRRLRRAQSATAMLLSAWRSWIARPPRPRRFRLDRSA